MSGMRRLQRSSSSAAGRSTTNEIRTVLEELRAHYDASGAAIYVTSDHGDHVRWLHVGEGTAERWTGDDDGPAVRVDGGIVAFSPGADLSASNPIAMTAVSALLRGRHLEREVQHRRFQAGLEDVRLQSLYDVGLAIASTLDGEQLVDEILLRAVALLDASRGALYFSEEAGLRLAGAVGGDALPFIDLDSEVLSELLTDTGGAEVLPGVAHVLARPIEADCRQLGLLVVGDKESRVGVGPFADSDAPTLGLFASQAAIALENARLHREALDKERMEREMELAAEIQERLLPRRLPTLDEFEFAAWSRSARHIGGDYHDLIEMTGNRVALVVGDVSGKGVPAALLVSTIYSALRLLLDQVDVSEDLLSRLNDHIAASSAPNKFVTFFIATVGGDTPEFVYGNAGHNPALLITPDGAIEELGPGGMPLGMIAGVPYVTNTAAFTPGGVLCIYSDGITEAESTDDEEFGLDRLKEVLREARNESCETIVERICTAVQEFSTGAPQADDETLVVARWR